MGGRFRRWSPAVAVALVAGGGVPLVALAPSPALAAGDLWVDGSSPSCSDGFTREQAGVPLTPWCSVVRAAEEAGAGDTVRIRPGTYAGTVRPATSGSLGAPVRFVADGGGVTLDGAGASATVKLVSVTDVSLEGLAVTGAAVQGIWAYGAQRITLGGLSVTGNGGPGIQVRESSAVTVTRSRIAGNGGAGIFETAGSSGNRYVANEVTTNGINGDPYNGDGMQLAGAGTYVGGNTITGNGDPGPYEHGIYTGPGATDFLIEGNIVDANAGSNIKAGGSGGVVRYNRLEGGRLGLVLSDNATPVTAYYNLVFGPYQHGVFVTTGTGPARARLWNNTVVVTSRNAPSGDASALFVNSAASLDVRNNLLAYSNPDNAGSAVYVPDAAKVQGFTSDRNWLATADPAGRHLAWNGVRLTLPKWRRHGLDAKSIASEPPTLDADARVVSANLGRRKGQALGLTRDYAGTLVPAGVSPDIGAYQAP
ncbi:MAG: right-handed parallel beta-helix repeat-containing protein [Actinomycetota bacterium]